uniref:TBC1 domain family member 13 (Trinotate prediction) n=1 Tax=Myxobolus squamalis TaxID=59785 RepID=A0A6B2G2B8_MYXSQ
MKKNDRVECWKILLNFTPLELNQRSEKITKYRDIYLDLVDEFFFKSPLIEDLNDHPLSTRDHSNWSMHFRDKDTMNSILRDTIRLRCDLDFFHNQTKFPLSFFAQKFQHYYDYHKLLKCKNVSVQSYPDFYQNSVCVTLN